MFRRGATKIWRVCDDHVKRARGAPCGDVCVNQFNVAIVQFRVFGAFGQHFVRCVNACQANIPIVGQCAQPRPARANAYVQHGFCARRYECRQPNCVGRGIVSTATYADTTAHQGKNFLFLRHVCIIIQQSKKASLCLKAV